MWQVIECSGHPRDLGYQQGLALRAPIRQRAEQAGLSIRRSRWPSLAAFTSGATRGMGSGREMIRHFTHLAERADGLALGANIPLDSLLRLQELSPSGKSDGWALCAADAGDGVGASLSLSLAESSGLVRRSLPEVGFASLEVTSPWQVSAWGGVNEAGLAACIVPGAAEGSPPLDAPGQAVPAAASIELFVQECLQRFEDVEAGIGWCMDRPAAGEGTIVLGDAAGHRGAIRFARGNRTPERGQGGPLVAGNSEAILDALRAWALVEARQENGQEPAPLSASLGDALPPACLHLVCGQRQFEIRQGASEQRVLALGADGAPAAPDGTTRRRSD